MKMVKRVRFKNDKEATAKQRKYVESLLTKMKEEAKNSAPEISWFWELAELPEDLTRWEASGLISWLRDSAPRFVALTALEIVKQRLEGKKVTDADRRFALLALGPAIERLAQELRELEEERR